MKYLNDVRNPHVTSQILLINTHLKVETYFGRDYNIFVIVIKTSSNYPY